jgi:hypothetical protein
MQIRIHLLTSIVAAMLAGGCASGRSARVFTNTVAAAGGAIAGRALGNGEALPTALGASAGLLTGEVLNFGAERTRRRAFDQGVEKGRSDSAKERYAALVAQQRVGPVADISESVRLVEVPLPERRVNGLHFAPATMTLRIHE